MSYREIMAVCSEIHTKHINSVCGQNVGLLNVKLAVHIMTSSYKSINSVLPTKQKTDTKAYRSTKFPIKTKNNFKSEQSPIR